MNNLASCVSTTFWEAGKLPDLMGEGGCTVDVALFLRELSHCSLD